MRALRVIRNLLAVIGAGWLLWFFFQHGRSIFALSLPWVWTEKARIQAPAGRVDFVIYEGNRGAMSSFRYSCFLLAPGESIDPNKCEPFVPALLCSRVMPEASWTGTNRVSLKLDGALIFHHRPHLPEFGVTVDIPAQAAPAALSNSQ